MGGACLNHPKFSSVGRNNPTNLCPSHADPGWPDRIRWNREKFPLPRVELGKAVVSLPLSAEGRQGEWQWDISALALSCSPQSLGVWMHDQHFVGNATFMLCRGARAGRAEPHDAQPGPLVVPRPQLRSCVAKPDGLAPADSLKCHIARLRNEQGNGWSSTGATLLPLSFFSK